jgi:chromosome partitioning protein
MVDIMKSVALLARKGGTGKTTCAIHMGVLAQAAGLKVAFIDLDPQRSLTAWWHSRAADTPILLEANASARRLGDVLQVAAAEGYDLAVIDTPPAVTFDTAQVAAAVDLVLIPLRPSILDIYAVESTAEVVKAARAEALLVLNACHPPQGIGEAPTTVEARKAMEGMALPVANASLSQRMDYTRALNDGEAVNEFAPGCKAALEMERLWREVRRRLS